MLTNWISPEAMKSLNDGFVVAIMLEANDRSTRKIEPTAVTLHGSTLLR